jgi:cytochrome P450 family 12
MKAFKMLSIYKFNFSLVKATRLLSTSPKYLAAQSDESVKSFDEIPGPKSSYELLRLMGGKYKDLPLDELVKSWRKDYGNIARFPGFLGLRGMVMTFVPEDIEKMHRQEGKFPIRRVLDSIAYYRQKHRPDLYPAGGGLTTT